MRNLSRHETSDRHLKMTKRDKNLKRNTPKPQTQAEIPRLSRNNEVRGVLGSILAELQSPAVSQSPSLTSDLKTAASRSSAPTDIDMNEFNAAWHEESTQQEPLLPEFVDSLAEYLKGNEAFDGDSDSEEAERSEDSGSNKSVANLGWFKLLAFHCY